MKLDYTYSDIANIFGVKAEKNESPIHTVAFDTRRIPSGDKVLFFALRGVFRDGHEFILEAYNKGVRHFVVNKFNSIHGLAGANEIVVLDTLIALQELATYHRNRFNCPVVAITGSNGKTTVKEWLSHLLIKKYQIARSPKSYNSQIGVPFSLFEINSSTEIAVIEAGISMPDEMKRLQMMIAPTHGIFTSFGTAHQENFPSQKAHFHEKLKLFDSVNDFLYPEDVVEWSFDSGSVVLRNEFEDILKKCSFKDPINLQNARLVIAMAFKLGVGRELIEKSVVELVPLALRLETFEGIQGNTILNDTYNLDMDSLRHSLEYQLANCHGKKRVVIIGLPIKDENKERAIHELIEEFAPDEFFFHYMNEPFDYLISNANILIKGTRQSRMERIARRFKLRNHQTFVEINLQAIRHNINAYKILLKPNTKVLCMVKASSYGSDARQMGVFLQQMGIDYLGVAYPDEGIELREKGVKLPILVMNCEEDNFAAIIEHNLEPAIFSHTQLTAFIKELIDLSVNNYPIHIKLETGMNRLGFISSEIYRLIDTVKGQPEVVIKSVYSHLAESDVKDSVFTGQQIELFNTLSSLIQNEFSWPIVRHILNSEGIVNYTKYQFDMVRLGIGMYGISSDKNHILQLTPAISWFSTISQIKNITKGDTVGYSRSFVAFHDMQIAIIPVGYADGFRRSLSQGKGGVYIHGNYCAVVGNVCMDMIMVDVSAISAKEGDTVEIIGPKQTIQELAIKSGTIPYEILTNLSKRVHRVFIS